MVQNIIIAIIVVCCAYFIIRKFYRQLKGSTPSCGCSCSGCSPGQEEIRKRCDTPDNGDEKPECCP